MEIIGHIFFALINVILPVFGVILGVALVLRLGLSLLGVVAKYTFIVLAKSGILFSALFLLIITVAGVNPIFTFGPVTATVFGVTSEMTGLIFSDPSVNLVAYIATVVVALGLPLGIGGYNIYQLIDTHKYNVSYKKHLSALAEEKSLREAARKAEEDKPITLEDFLGPAYTEQKLA